MRTGMDAVCTLLNVNRGVPEVWGSKVDVREPLRIVNGYRDPVQHVSGQIAVRDDGHPEKQLLQPESASFQAFGTGKSAGGSNHAVQGIPFEVSVARLSLAERKDISGCRQKDVRSKL